MLRFYLQLLSELKPGRARVEGLPTRTGVCYLAGRWVARIRRDGELEYLGSKKVVGDVNSEESLRCLESLAKIYDQAAILLHGIKADINRPFSEYLGDDTVLTEIHRTITVGAIARQVEAGCGPLLYGANKCICEADGCTGLASTTVENNDRVVVLRLCGL